jgi:hypothetical protein
MAITQPRYHLLRLKKPRHHKHSQGGLQLETKHRKTGHATIHGAEFEHVHKRLHTQAPPHLIHRHEHHISAGHKHVHSANQASTGVHQQRATEKHTVTHESRSAAAQKAALTRHERGEKTGFARLSHAQRSVMARKAAATKHTEGIKPFQKKQ